MALSTDEVADALSEVGYDASDVVEVGTGAWSSCFAFRADGRDLVVRFGPYVEDFEKDRFAARFSCAATPVPSVEVLRIAGDSFLAVSTRAPGMALEEVSGSEWDRLVPAIVELLEALRSTAIPDGGFGAWDGAGIARDRSWRDHLLAVRGSTGDRRPLDWYQRLGDRPAVQAAFDDGYARLAALDLSAAPRSLIHADLINRNVHVVDDRVTGVFDWGCGRYGDHLYDASWFEFWAPFHPHLDVELLLTELRHLWTRAGIDISGQQPRRLACLLHIGLDHIAYNATRGTWTDVDDVAARMRDLGLV